MECIFSGRMAVGGQLFLLQLLDQPMFAIIGALSTAQANVQLDGVGEKSTFGYLCNPKLHYTITKKIHYTAAVYLVLIYMDNIVLKYSLM